MTLVIFLHYSVRSLGFTDTSKIWVKRTKSLDYLFNRPFPLLRHMRHGARCIVVVVVKVKFLSIGGVWSLCVLEIDLAKFTWK